MSGTFTHDFNARYDFQKNQFDRERDDARPTFYLEKVWNEKTGVMDEVEMVKVSQPNERLNIWGGKVTETHRRRWPAHYKAFKDNDVTPTNGIPLARWPDVAANLEFLDQMKGFGLWTVEDMANMNDIAMQKFHGARTWKHRALQYLDEQQKIADAAKAQADAETSADVVQLKEQVAMLMAKLAEKDEAPPAMQSPAMQPGRQNKLGLKAG